MLYNRDMVQEHKLPPEKIYSKAKRLWGADWYKGVVFTYGDVVYCKRRISDDVLVHETVHTKQQEKIGKDKRWDLYFEDDNFRLVNEVEAYRTQWDYIQRNEKDRNYKYIRLSEIARDLSSELYGNLVSFGEAYDLITKKYDKETHEGETTTL